MSPTFSAIWIWICLSIVAPNLKQVMLHSCKDLYFNTPRRECHNSIYSDLADSLQCQYSCEIYFKNSFFPTLQLLSTNENYNYESRISSLIMNYSSISDISPGFFGILPELKNLDLSNNNISYLTAGIFNSLSKLEKLNLSSNIIQNVSDQTFFGLVRLISLDLCDNHIKSLSSIFHVQEANFEIPQSHRFVMPRIESVNVSHNEISELVPPGSSVLAIDVSYNNITTISAAAFSQCYALEILNLHHNHIESLPRNIFKNLSRLESLDMSFNHLNETQYGQFDDLVKLKYLNLSNNNLNLEFHKLLTLAHVEELQLSNNTFSDFEAVSLLNHFPRLRLISLYNQFWECRKLAVTVNLFKSKNILVVPGTNYTDQHHIIGIPCHDDDTFRDRINTSPYNSSTLGILYKDISGYLRKYNLYLGDISAKIDKLKSNYENNDVQKSVEELLSQIEKTETTENSSQTNVYKLLQHEMELNLQKSESRLLAQRLERLENTLNDYFSNYSLASAHNEKLTSLGNKISHSESFFVDILLFLILSVLLTLCYLYFKNTLRPPKRDEVELV